MNGNNALLDSNIVIYLSKNILNFDTLASKYEEFYISIITYMEVLGYKFKTQDEKIIISELFAQFEIINIDLSIADTVISIRNNHKIKLPDAIILATAKNSDCDLITRNISDFTKIIKTVNVINPFEY
ncbi:MAG: type II toxin-antitoxin system VapC family toxin [Candidatus Cloacimonetes bacterium]|nr:type II toxin-antitoxin system VapC family toxin [Candidatus Cloacimonadota bacterium]